MKFLSLLTLTTLAATPIFAEETRQMGRHEHGVGQLDIAFDGSQIALELHAPGADIVGFEYAAQSAEDLAKVEAALVVLAQPLDLFALPQAANCSVVQAQAELEREGDHESEHEDEGHEDHKEDHDAHADEAGHTEFHAQYLLNCADVSLVNEISFAYFTAFPNAHEVEVQILTQDGARAFEVERDAPMLDLSGLN